jgi:hypothetical protein
MSFLEVQGALIAGRGHEEKLENRAGRQHPKLDLSCVGERKRFSNGTTLA